MRTHELLRFVRTAKAVNVEESQERVVYDECTRKSMAVRRAEDKEISLAS